MVLSGTIAARPSASLRCELRKALLQTRLQTRPPRCLEQRCAFATAPRLHEELAEAEAEAEHVLVKTKTGYRWKDVNNDPGRIVGKPGKRQRVVSQRLTRESLNRPSNVIVFRDVREEPDPTPTQPPPEVALDEEFRSQAFSAQDIENAVTGRYIAPADAEVNSSIDTLKPKETIVDQEEFEGIRQTLLKGYNYKQLHRYLVSSGSASVLDPRAEEQTDALALSQWKPGESQLSERHVHDARKTRKHSKVHVTEQILRLAWHMTIQSEVQEIGEIEVRLQPWQSSMLFDLTVRNKSFYEHCIGSEALAEACKIYDLRAEGVARILGRRYDATEIARQLSTAVMSAKRIEINLTSYLHLLANRVQLVDDEIVSFDDLRHISDLTKCVVTLENGLVAIYGNSDSNRRSAQRMVLSLLDLKFPASFDGILADVGVSGKGKSRRGGKAVETVPVRPLLAGLHRRYRGLELARMVKRVPKQEEQKFAAQLATPSHESATKMLVKELDVAPEPSHGHLQQHPDSYWQAETRLTDWEAEYCNILQQVQSTTLGAKSKHRRASKTSASSASGKIVQHHLSGVETVLSYFGSTHVPRPLNPAGSKGMKAASSDNQTFDKRMPYLNVHFIPAAASQSSSRKLPQLRMKFRFSTPSQSGDGRKIRLVGLIATLDQQHLTVPLPEYATDLRCNRELVMLCRLDMALVNEHVTRFSAALQESVQTGEGALDVPSELIFSLPGWLVRGNGIAQSKSGEEIEIPYVVERFEQVQSVAFKPSPDNLGADADEQVKTTLAGLPGNFYLDYRETEGGAIHGSQTSLRMRRLSSPTLTSEGHADSVVHGHSENVDSNTAQPTPVDDSSTGSDAVSPTNEGDTVASDVQGWTPQTGNVHGTGSRLGVDNRRGESEGADVEQTAKSSPDSSANTSVKLATAALGIANLLTRASNGGLKVFEKARIAKGANPKDVEKIDVE